MESRLERKLKRNVEKFGARAWKFVSPGLAGVPDRIILLPGGNVIFVEMKDEGEKQKPLQKKRAQELEELGFKVFCLDSDESIGVFIREVFSCQSGSNISPSHIKASPRKKL